MPSAIVPVKPALTGVGPVFDFGGRPVRTAGTPDAPLFCAADVCAVLGLENVSQACTRVKDSQKTTLTSNESGGIPRTYVYVTEPGLYRLIGSSRKPEAEAFQDWVAEDVLPAIRKTGSYTVAPKDPIAALQLAQTAALEYLARQAQATEARVAQLEAHQQPDPEFYTVLAWCRILGRSVLLPEAASLGRECACVSREHGYRIGEALDARFGTVKQYHVDVLRAVIGDERLDDSAA